MKHGSAAAWLSGFVAAGVIAVPGLAGIAFGQPLLFPSLGPTATLQAYSPRHRSARLHVVILAHLLGLGSAMAVVRLLGLAGAPSTIALGRLTWPRVVAGVLAVGMATVLEHRLHVSHPPAASTTLLVALGSFKADWHDAAVIAGGIVMVGLAGEVARRTRAGRPG